MKKLLIVLIAAAEPGLLPDANLKNRGRKAINRGRKNYQLRDTANFTSIQWIDSTFQDLGTVKEGPEVDISFKFKNTGNKNLVIENVTASCGCTIVRKPQQPFQPGETGSIKAKFTTEGHAGTNNKSIYVIANTKGTTSQELKFRIVVEKVNHQNKRMNIFLLQSSGGGGIGPLIFLPLMILVFWLFFIRPQAKKPRIRKFCREPSKRR